MVTRRQKRVSELIRQEIGDLLERKVADPRLNLVTVTDVEISSDLRHARVYVSLIGSQEERQRALKSLRHAAGFFRHELASRLALRYTPDLTFYLDDSLERGERIGRLLEEIQRTKAQPSGSGSQGGNE